MGGWARARALSCVLAMLASWACASASGPEARGPGGGAGGDGGLGGDGSTAGDGAPRFDSGIPDQERDTGLLPSDACRRVDLLFAVDDSGSMQEEKDALRGTVFPAFARALIDVGGGLDDYRVGVIDACPRPANLHTRGDGGECNFESGQVWMTSNSTMLEEEFGCVGDIYSDDVDCSGSNDDEQPASAAATALEAPWITGPNAGFLRSDALLVVVAITDEDETPDPDATAAEVFDRLVAIKGDVRRMVFLGIGGSRSCNGVYGGADHASVLEDVTGRFITEGRGVFWDLCEGQLEDGLTQAMDVIESACQELPDLI